MDFVRQALILRTMTTSVAVYGQVSSKTILNFGTILLIINTPGVLCGDCDASMGVSALMNECVTCSEAHGLLIATLGI